MKKIEKISNTHTNNCMETVEILVKDLLVDYHKKTTSDKDRREIAKVIKGLYDTSISAAQVTVNAIKIAILAKSKDITFKSIQS